MVMARLLTTPPARARASSRSSTRSASARTSPASCTWPTTTRPLVGGRIWTEREQIEQRLADLTEHMETVIQKYLRNEFETIEEYNAQAGEVAEPYRFLVDRRFPRRLRRATPSAGWPASPPAAPAAASTRSSSATRALPMPARARTSTTCEAHSVNLVRSEDGKFVWKDEVFSKFPLTLDAAARARRRLTQHAATSSAARPRTPTRRGAVRAHRAAKPDKFWTSAASERAVACPLGRLGATRLQTLRLGKGIAQHVLIAGKTGSGKSTLLHALITNLAMWYSPDEVELYLIDFKKGVEFKTYADARAAARPGDRRRERARVRPERPAAARRRAEAPRRNLPQARRAGPGRATARRPAPTPMPRMLLIVDEFQEFFIEDDKLAQEAALLLDRLVRQGRAFGIHVLLGSQTLGGASRPAAQHHRPDGRPHRAAVQRGRLAPDPQRRQLRRPAALPARRGDLQRRNGLVEGNSPFQVVWLPDEQREELPRQACSNKTAARELRARRAAPIVFEGNAPADIRKNRAADAAARRRGLASRRPRPLAWLGEPVAIKDPTAVAFRRQSGANLLIVGQHDEAAHGDHGCRRWSSLAAQHPPSTARSSTSSTAPRPIRRCAGTFDEGQARSCRTRCKLVEWRAVAEAINELAAEMERRQDADDAASRRRSTSSSTACSATAPPQDARTTSASRRRRRGEEARNPTSSSPTSSAKARRWASTSITWCDTPANLDRTLDRGVDPRVRQPRPLPDERQRLQQPDRLARRPTSSACSAPWPTAKSRASSRSSAPTGWRIRLGWTSSAPSSSRTSSRVGPEHRTHFFLRCCIS